jgi:molecular chaperone GrpE (heat shock protein)
MECWAFQNGPNCTQCEHNYTSHVHLREKHVQVKKEVQKIDPSTKSAIDQIQDEKQKRKALLDEVQKQLANYQNEIDNLHKIINQTIQDMRLVCSRFDYVKEIESIIIVLDEQIEICMAEMSTDPKKDRELASYQAVKKNMVSLLKGVQKHITV